MQHLEVSCAVRPIKWPLGVKWLNTIAKDDFYKGIQKLYDRANLCVQLEGMYVEN